MVTHSFSHPYFQIENRKSFLSPTPISASYFFFSDPWSQTPDKNRKSPTPSYPQNTTYEIQYMKKIYLKKLRKNYTKCLQKNAQKWSKNVKKWYVSAQKWYVFVKKSSKMRVFFLPILPNRYKPTPQSLFLAQKSTSTQKNFPKIHQNFKKFRQFFKISNF